jgi:hypothetical protein
MDTVHVEENLLVEPSQARPDVELEHDFQTTLLETGFEVGSVSYAPSIAKTDFTEFLPGQSVDEELELSRNYDTAAVVSSAWTSLQSEIPKLPWEQDFWSGFLNPAKPALEQFYRGFKRPLPFHYEGKATSTPESEVERRVVYKTYPGLQSFIKHIKDVPEKSWQEERDALWEIAIRRWVAVLDACEAGDNLLLLSLQCKTSFTEKAQILVDVFFNKAPQTLMKRVNSLSKLCNSLAVRGLSFPCKEDEFYQFLKSESETGAPSSRLKACFEAVVFARHVLGMESLQTLVNSRRCLGAASQQGPTCPRQASPFTVAQLKRLHDVLREGPEMWNRAMAGMLLFCIYGRARWSDAQHAEDLLPDFDGQGHIVHLEVRTAVHKTARAFHLCHMFLPLSAPATGVTDDAWGAQWLEVRKILCIENMRQFPLMPAPNLALEATRRPVSTHEAKMWIGHLLCLEDVNKAKLTSHSCKCTCLSFLAKRGASIEDRLVLGYHSNKMRMALTYSRASIARPLALLSHVLMEIRTGVFEPDNSRSGRLNAGATSLDKTVFFATAPAERVEHADTLQSTELDAESSDLGSWNLIKSVDAVPVEETALDGHITTDSSDSSDEEVRITPVVGHYEISIPDDKQLWLNQNSKMFHLTRKEYRNVLLCGRRVGQNFRHHEGLVRYDSAKCRMCFRLKDS